MTDPIPKALLPLAPLLALALAACHSGESSGLPGDANSHQPYGGIGPDEIVHFTGTEPFWGGQVKGTVLTYNTPEDPAGATVTAIPFAGRNGVSWSGTLAGAQFVLAVTPDACSDGMSERSYPLTVTLKLGEETRKGCAWSDRHPFSGPPNP